MFELNESERQSVKRWAIKQGIEAKLVRKGSQFIGANFYPPLNTRQAQNLRRTLNDSARFTVSVKRGLRLK